MPARALPLLLVLAAAAVPAAAWAQDRGSGIQRCERADGTQVYTDQDCGAFGAAPAPIQGELLVRLANDGGDVAPGPRMVDAAWSASGPTAPSAAPAGALPLEPVARPAVSRRGPRGCARSPTQLVMELQAAWAGADVNRLAALYHWAGSDTAAAESVMPRLQSMAAMPLQDIRHYGTGGGPVQLASAGAAPLGEVIQVQVGSGDRTRLHEFRVVDHQGCQFVRF